MPNIGVTIKAIEEAGLRDSVKIMIGGAPVTQAFADEVALTPPLRMPVPPPFVPSSSSRLKQRFRAASRRPGFYHSSKEIEHEHENVGGGHHRR